MSYLGSLAYGIPQIKLPEGVLSIISGFGPTAGAPLCSHMDVDKLHFTGSTDTEKTILSLSAKSDLKPATLELGGNSPFLVCGDADIDTAVEQAHFALFLNQDNVVVLGPGPMFMGKSMMNFWIRQRHVP